MSKTVDERVLEMRFDNQQFERNVQTSMNTLDKLKHSLNLEGATKGLENVGRTANGLKLNGLSTAVDTVKNKFSALEVMAITALANITNQAVNAGKRLVASFTIEPVKQGFEEYELKMGSIQTIMASTGEELSTVNKYLDELNTYADKTIYSFSDMTSNIGKFTNSGVKLEDAVKAIQGISNEAAVSGANTNEASRAMYNFAQALSAGYVKLIDWKSIENANMATVEFKQQLLDTALAMGTVVKVGDDYKTVTTDNNGKVSELFNATKNFNDALGHQWMTTEVLVQTLSNYSTDVRTMSKEEKKAYEEKLRTVGYTEEQIKSIEELGKKAFNAAQDVKTFSQLMDTLKEAAGSGWARTFEIIIGDFDEAKALWTSVSNVVGGFIDRTSDARNALFEGWKELGGRAAVIEAIKNSFDGILSIVKPIGKAFRDIFPPMTAERLVAISEKLRDLTASLKLSNRMGSFLRLTFRGLFSVVNIGKQFVVALAKQIAPLLKNFGGLGRKVLILTARFGKWLTSIDEYIAKNDTFTKAFERIKEVLKQVIENVVSIYNTTKSKIQDIYSTISTVITNITDTLNRLQDRFSGVTEAIKEFKRTKIKAPNTDGLMSFTDKVQARLEPIKKMGELIKSVFKAVGTVITSVFNKIKPFITRLGEIILNTLADIWNGLQKAFYGEGFDSLLDILNGGLMVAIGAGITKFIKSITGVIDGFKKFTTGKDGFVKSIQNIFSGVGEAINTFTASIKADILKKIAISIAILAASLIALSLVDSEKLTISIAAISAMFVELAAAMSFMSSNFVGSSSISSASTTMIKMSIAIAILAGALKSIGSLGLEGVATGLTGIAGIMTSIIAFAYAWEKLSGSFSKSDGFALIEMAVAMKIFASAMKLIASLSWEELTRALLGLAGALNVVVIALNSMDTEGLLRKATSVMAVSLALTILGAAMKIFASLSWEEIGKAMLVLAGGMIVMVTALNKLDSQGVAKAAAGLLIMSISLTILGGALKIMASLSWEEIGKALVALGGSLLIVVTALNSFKKEGIVKAAAAMIVMSTALVILGGALKKIGSLSLAEIGKSLLAIAGSLAAIVIAFNSFKYSDTMKTAAAMLVMSVALTGLGNALKVMGSMSLAEIGKSLLLLAGAFVVLGVAGALMRPVVGVLIGLSVAIALIGVGIAALGVGILSLAAGLTSLSLAAVASATTFVAAFKIILIGILTTIFETAETIARAVKALILALVDVVIECVPAIVNGALQLIVETIRALTEYIPEIVGLLVDLIIKILDALTERLPQLIDSAFKFVKALVKGIVDALKEVGASNLVKGIEWVGILGAIMVELAVVGSLAGAAMVGVLAMAAVIAELSVLLVAIGAIAQIPGLDWIIGEGGNLLETIGTAIGKFIGGIAGGFLEGVTSQFPEMAQNLSDFMTNIQGFIEGASKISASTFDGIGALVKAVLMLTAAEVVDGIAGWITGGNSLTEFGKELAEFGSYFAQYADAVKGINSATVEASATAALSLAKMAQELPNSGGLSSKIFGDNKLSEFGEELAAFGPFIKEYGDNVKGLDADAIQASVGAAQILANMADTLPNTGGLSAKIFGDNKLSDFGKELAEFGPVIKGYADTVKGLDSNAVTASASAAQMLSDMANTLPNSGGLTALIFGDNKLSDFGKELAEFGPSISAYAQAVKDVNPGTVTASASAALSLSELANNLPNSGGLLSIFTGDNTLSNFGKQVSDFGAGFKNYAESVANVDPETVTASANAAKVLCELEQNLPKSGGFLSIFTGEQSLANFGEELEAFGPHIQAYSDSIGNIDEGKVTASANAAKILSEMYQGLPEIGGLSSKIFGQQSLSNFGEELKMFGPAIQGYSDAITGIDEGKVTSSANAAKILAGMYQDLPDTGGLASKILGEKSISAFGKELETFGPAIQRYSDAITGIDADKVSSSANAAKMLAEMYDFLPNSNGLADLIFGEKKSIVDFGKELASFAPHLKKYSKSIAGIDEGAITASANAAKVLSEMASTLPNSDGLADLIFGKKKTLSEFGLELVKFGPYMTKYAKSIQYINADTVTASAAAAQTLVDLAAALPKTGGLVDFFTGNNDLGKFGTSLKTFGDGFLAYSNSVSGVDTAKLSNVAFQLRTLIDLANGISAVDTSGLASFAGNMKTYAVNGLNGFVEAFSDSNADSVVSTSVVALVSFTTSSMATHAVELRDGGKVAGGELIVGIAEGIVEKQPDVNKVTGDVCLGIINKVKDTLLKKIFMTYGSLNVAQGLMDGINQKRSAVIAIVGGLCTAIITAMNIGLPRARFRVFGANAIQGLIDGLYDGGKRAALRNAAYGLTTLVVSSVNASTMYNAMYQVGARGTQGLINGLNSKINELARTARENAKRVVDESKKGLDEHSPSKEMYWVGEYAMLGLINGLVSQNVNLQAAAYNTATNGVLTPMQEVIARASELIENGIDAEPTIRPVLDLSNIQNGVRSIGGLFSNGLNVSASYGRALDAGTTEDGTPIGGSSATSTNYNFTQNNYSPKALSRNEIYRQTKNQFAAMKGAVGSR